MARRRTTVIVTGLIGSGKSAVCALLRERGIPVYDSDARTKRLYSRSIGLVENLEKALGRPLREDEPQYRYGDQTRDEYAAYEQALYVLLRDCSPNSAGVVMPSAEPDEAQPTAHTMASGKDHFAAEALRWLGGNVRVETVLG